MATTFSIPTMAILILTLLFNPTRCNTTVNETTSEWCYGSENCLVGDESLDSEFLMETETSRMLLDFQNLQTPGTIDPNRQSVAECGRPPRYDSCTGEERQIPNPENCDVRNRANPC
uniref:Rapid ALkalinization Factor n=1 Tax=Cucumis sativus TaxID=3659 RepID=A0A0A0KVZ2_CUCSA